jgi:ABC-type dipeptide/oligopeptide/nickel transport system permease component
VLRFIARRVLLAPPVFLAVITVVFIVVRVLPGDPAQAALGDVASKAAVDALRARLGLDEALPVQYGRFLGALLRGDLGTSMINGTSIKEEIAYNLPFTLQLTLAALAIGLAVGIPTGVWTAVNHNRWPDVFGRIVSLTGLSLPAFFLGILLILLFSIRLQWVPAIGDSLALPALTLGLVMTASVTRLTRSAMLSGFRQDYVRTATAKGLGATAVIGTHALRPSLLPIVSLTGIWAVALIGDSVTTELVFARPGLGKMMVGAMLQRDYTAVQSVMVIYTAFVVVINLVTDIAYGVVDPRTRRSA